MHGHYTPMGSQLSRIDRETCPGHVVTSFAFRAGASTFVGAARGAALSSRTREAIFQTHHIYSNSGISLNRSQYPLLWALRKSCQVLPMQSAALRFFCHQCICHVDSARSFYLVVSIVLSRNEMNGCSSEGCVPEPASFRQGRACGCAMARPRLMFPWPILYGLLLFAMFSLALSKVRNFYQHSLPVKVEAKGT
jgi:hypothetical protein